MASFLFLVSLFLATVTLTTAFNSPAPSPATPPPTAFVTPPSPSPSPSPSQYPNPIQQAHFNTIIDAILSTGDFSNWANFLAQLDPSIIPFSATIFIPDDDAFLDASTRPPPSAPLTFIDPLLFSYHIIPHRFAFSDLLVFPIGARLPTLLESNTILITNNSVGNFSIDGVKVNRPDLYQNGAVCVHGIGGVLDYITFGNDNNNSNTNHTTTSTSDDFVDGEEGGDNNERPSLTSPEDKIPAGVEVSAGVNSSLCSCSWVKAVAVVCMVLFMMRVLEISELDFTCGVERSRVSSRCSDNGTCASDVYDTGCDWKLV